MEVAIVGIGCRFSGGVRSPADLWNMLLNKQDGMVETPPDRWSNERFYDPDPEIPGRMYVKKAGFLHDSLEEFDPEFFGISPREAAIMDPQQRLLLEVAQEALDDAGYAGRVAGRTVGVYIGGFTADNMAARHSKYARHSISMHTPTSSTYTMLSNRISYVFDLRGPSMTIDTACSSSLVALHEAVSALQRGEIEMAIVGGVNAMIRPETFISMCKGHFLAADGRCKTFDKDADGYARGEGAGVIILRRLDQAQAQGDRVYAVIRATGSNQDGRTPGITVPNPQAQAALMQEVTARSGVAPEDIGYVEAHGTGTAIGDPLELASIGKVLGAVPGRKNTLRVGSIKASIGHTEAAAGVASVIKTALILHHRTIVPQAWLNELNPAIPFDDYRISVPQQLEPFPDDYALPAASVNGFGYGGSNAYAVLVAAPPVTAADDSQRPRVDSARIFPVSGRNEEGVRTFAKELAEQVSTLDGTAALDALADAVWLRRVHQPLRYALPYQDKQDLLNRLEEVQAGSGKAAARVLPNGKQLVFVFSGMGPQWWGMARDLCQAEGRFAEVAREIDAIFRPLAGWSIIDALMTDESHSKMARTEVAQPANFLLQIALAAELETLGVRPAAIVGHSVGEVSAAYLSGMLSLQDAVKVSYHRSRLQGRMAGTGSMLAVGMSEEAARERLQGMAGVEIAAINSPAGVTLAGNTVQLLDLAEALNQEQVLNRMLRVEVPYHSFLMEPILEELDTVLADIQPRQPSIALYSTVTGRQVGPETLWDASYWLSNVRQPVYFADAVASLLADGYQAFLELGPHPTLSSNVLQVIASKGETGRCVSTLRREQPDVASIRQALAELYTMGALDGALPPGGITGAVSQQDLPCHQFQRVHLWNEEALMRRDRLGDVDKKVLPGFRRESSSPEWECDLSVGALPWLHDHVVAGATLLPGAAYLDAALAAAAQLQGAEQVVLEDVAFISPLVIAAHEAPMLRLSVDESIGAFFIRSRNDDEAGWALRARGRIVQSAYAPNRVLHTQADMLAQEERLTVSGEELYARLEQIGLHYGTAFRRIVQAEVGENTILARLDGIASDRHQAHPAVVDCALQCMAAWALLASEKASGPVVPAAVQSVRQFGPLPSSVQVLVTRLTPRHDESDMVADILLATADGDSVLELSRVQFRPISPRQSIANELEPLWYQLLSEPLTLDPPGEPDEEAAATARMAYLIVDTGQDRSHWAQQETCAMPMRYVRLAEQEPAKAADLLTPQLHALLRETQGMPITVLICSAGDEEASHTRHVDDRIDPNPFDMDRALTAMAALVGAAIATQEVLAAHEDTHGTVPQVRGVLVTSNALAISNDQVPCLNQSPLLGVRRVLRNEYSALRWRLLDYDRLPGFTALHDLLVRLEMRAPEADEVMMRDGVAYVQRLKQNFADHKAQLEEAQPLSDPEANFAIEFPASRLLSDLALRAIPRQAPQSGEIELRLDALELNYKDAMKAIGLLGEKELGSTYFGTAVGMSGVGVVSRVGPDVHDVRVGDALIFGCKGMAQRYVTARLDNGFFVSRDPAIPITTFSAMVPLLTAQYSIFHAARVQAGEIVLVHGAAGGVGMASVMAAKAAGARVFATASTAERREMVKAMGAEQVFDSRTLNFVDEIIALTDGRGADVIISSAPGEVIAANLKVAAEFGRVVEIGKLDIFTSRQLSLSPFEKNLSFISVDIDRMSACAPELVRQLQDEIVDMMRSEKYQPLPTHLLPLSRIDEAFHMVQRSSHIGRVMLDFRDADVLIKPQIPATEIHPDASYLITGGFGAFGLATARWLVRKGARHLVLMGRSGAVTSEQKLALAALEAAGVNVVTARLDIANLDQLSSWMATSGRQLPPIRGVFHAAGVVQDGPFSGLTEQVMRHVLAPKALGAINLHRAIQAEKISLDYFVLYSSITAINGTVPQTSYAAANTMLDSLADYLKAQGQAVTAINWGALGGGGMAEASDEVARYLAMMGLHLIDMDHATDYMDYVIASGVGHAMICKVDWGVWGQAYGASAGTTRFADIVNKAAAGMGSSNAVLKEIMALPDGERVDALIAVLIKHISSVMGIAADSIDNHTPLSELGMDSLMAVELNLSLTTVLGVELSVLEFNRGGGLAALAARLLPRMVEAEKARQALRNAQAQAQTEETTTDGPAHVK